MQSYVLMEEWSSLTDERRWAAWELLVEKINRQKTINGYDAVAEFIFEALATADMLSEEDYWGTEGIEL